ncbi:MAG: hypothetical protein J5793_03645 [Clostridia bacterium]|nr:hypothetical protein [Clostridia bacterium]
MCTSIISNRKKTLVGWNLDLLGMEHRVTASGDGVFIEILDKTEGWMPLFGANRRGEFVGMPTCWPYDGRSDPRGGEINVINLDIDLLLMKKTFAETKETALAGRLCSVPGMTFMSSLSDAGGNVLHIVPGQGAKYYEKPVFKVLTNFSPFKTDGEQHPWMWRDRYDTAVKMLSDAGDGFDVDDCFSVLKAVSQTFCPTVVSMVFDVAGRTVYWCEDRRWDDIKKKKLRAAAESAASALRT